MRFFKGKKPGFSWTQSLSLIKIPSDGRANYTTSRIKVTQLWTGILPNLVRVGLTNYVETILFARKKFIHTRMGYRLASFILKQVLLRNICDLAGFLVFRQQVIKWLIFIWTYIFRYRLPPLFSVGKFRINVKHHTTKREKPMPHDSTDLKFSSPDSHEHNLA